MTIQADEYRRRVVWTMDANTARDVARFMRENIPSGDLANADCDALEEAADAIDPPPEGEASERS